MNRCHVSQALSQHAQTDRLVDSDIHSASHRMCCSPVCRIPTSRLRNQVQLGRIKVTQSQKVFYLLAKGKKKSRHWKSRMSRFKSRSALRISGQRLRLGCAALTFTNSSRSGELGSCWNVIWIGGPLLISCLVLPDPTRGGQAPVLSAITSEHIPPSYGRNSIVSSADILLWRRITHSAMEEVVSPNGIPGLQCDFLCTNGI